MFQEAIPNRLNSNSWNRLDMQFKMLGPVKMNRFEQKEALAEFYLNTPSDETSLSHPKLLKCIVSAGCHVVTMCKST